MKATLITIGVIAIAVGLWFGGWALAGANQTKQYQVNTSSQQYQAGLVAQERDRVQGYATATDDAQKKQIALTFCQVYPDLKPAPADLVAAQSTLC